MVLNRFTGPYALQYWLLILLNIAVPQLLWMKQVRSNVWALWAISMCINVGMWLERFVIIVVSLHRDYVPSNWAMYSGTKFDVMTFVGTIGLFLTLLLLFLRFLPALNMFEMRILTPEATKAHGEEK
jgi:molybdopterin-containing oxidoreductase family membrane subunit